VATFSGFSGGRHVKGGLESSGGLAKRIPFMRNRLTDALFACLLSLFGKLFLAKGLPKWKRRLDMV